MATTTMAPPTTDSALQRETLCMQLHVKMPGVRVKADKSKLDFDGVDTSMLHVSKDIIDSDEYRAVRKHVSYIKAYLRSKSLPSPMLRGGFYMIPMSILEDVEENLTARFYEFDTLVGNFVAAYQNGLIDEARERLGSQFNENDYPMASELGRAFNIERVYVSVDVPGKLRSVNQALFEKEKKKSEARWRDLEAEAEALLRNEMSALVNKMVEQLGRTEDGRKKAFHKKNVAKLSEFLDNAPFRNVTNDAELTASIKEATKLLDGIDVDGVRKDDKYRDAVQESFSVLKGELDRLVVDKPTRKITFGDA